MGRHSRPVDSDNPFAVCVTRSILLEEVNGGRVLCINVVHALAAHDGGIRPMAHLYKFVKSN